jgi:hypothetical protein
MTADFSPDPPFEHYNYDVLEGRDINHPACQCFLCREWFAKSDAFKASELACEGHKNRCRCDDCKVRHKVRLAMIAAGMRRDIYSELSFLTKNETWRDEILAWFLNFIKTTNKKDSWFALKAEGHPLNYWLQKWATERSLKRRARFNRKNKVKQL